MLITIDGGSCHTRLAEGMRSHLYHPTSHHHHNHRHCHHNHLRHNRHHHHLYHHEWKPNDDEKHHHHPQTNVAHFDQIRQYNSGLQ